MMYKAHDKMKTKAREPDLLPTEVIENACAMLRVVTHPHRLRICEILSREQVPVGEIASRLAVPENAVSQHLSLMKAHGILGSKRRGREVLYFLAHPGPQWLLQCIRKHRAE
jgi:ArsR family transcriptional regulator, virulence genes transcriptional regulator